MGVLANVNGGTTDDDPRSLPPTFTMSNNGQGGGGADADDEDLSLSVTSEHASTIGPDSSTDRTHKDATRDRNLEIAQREERAVSWIRLVTLVVVVICAVGVCTLVYLFARNSDQRNFELEYNLLVGEIQELVVWEVEYNFALVEQLTASITSEAIMSNQTFPNVTMPHFEITGGFVDGMGGIMMASFAPLISSLGDGTARQEWEAYSVEHAKGWLEQSAYLKVASPHHRDPLHGTIQDHEHDRRRRHLSERDLNQLVTNNLVKEENDEEFTTTSEAETQPESLISPQLWKWVDNKRVVVTSPAEVSGYGLYAPLWQSSPFEQSAVNNDLLQDPRIAKLYKAMIETDQTVLSPGYEMDNLMDWMFDPIEKVQMIEPHGFIMESVRVDFGRDQDVVGIVLALTSFRNLLTRLVPEGTNGIYAVITGNEACERNMTFILNGPIGVFLGYEDLHEGLDEYERTIDMELYNNATSDALCRHQLHIYPSVAYIESYNTSRALFFTITVALAFFITTLLFVVYERLVTRRERTKNAALKLISSLFPQGVHDKVLKGAQDSGGTSGNKNNSSNVGGVDSRNLIASFYPNTTILFADIEGFTAWSSTREPSQVFYMLETVYGAFDEIARRRNIFKVETVGDCYVAVCGLPEPREDHAVAMARFARDIQARHSALAKQLEVMLGPDTADLGFRIGLHSGPVTGGVLRGQNSRFQLFGDTMNMAARMESTSMRDKIQMSSATAKLLIDAGKGRWIIKRPDLVDVKGKGSQETYFLRTSSTTKPSSSSGKGTSINNDRAIDTFLSTDCNMNDVDDDDFFVQEPAVATSPSNGGISKKMTRLIDWNTEVLSRRIKSIVAARQQNQRKQGQGRRSPDTSRHGLDDSIDINDIPLPTIVIKQLRDYVKSIAVLYREDNPFHNYEHASHVMLSIEKMLSRVTVNASAASNSSKNNSYHDYDDVTDLLSSGHHKKSSSSHGGNYANDICRDPLAQFAVVLAALIHDVDHYGVPNATLIEEQDPVAVLYHGKSPAENHSLRVGWEILTTNPKYSELLSCVCGDDVTKEVQRLQKLLTDAVLATDVFDPELKESRNERWSQVFNDNSDGVNNAAELNHLKAQIVLEHLIQASDVAHTMQHWHVYIKWNERLFFEMTKAYHDGRMKKNPAEFWYEGEIGFLTHYIIPLAKKLHDCQVFGVSCDEFMDYASANLQEWKLKGKSIVDGFVTKYNRKHNMTKIAFNVNDTVNIAGVESNKSDLGTGRDGGRRRQSSDLRL